MQEKRVKNTKQRNLTPEQEVEKQAANMQFYNGDITKKFFDHQKDIEEFVVVICRKMGFTPCAQNRKTGDFIQYCCEFSGWPSPSAKFSKKTGCPFYVNISKTKNGFHVSSLDARHNHPIINTDFMFDKETEDEIHRLKAAGLAPRHISKILETEGKILPSILINSITNKIKNANVEEEFIELYRLMSEINGECIPFDYIQHNMRNPIRCAIWTQSPSEHNNLLRYGDIIMFDSTESNLKNGWLTIPVSVVDSNRHILPAGLCFIAFETEEVLEFLCKSIFSDENVRNINNVIITDEDQAYKAIISKLRHLPKHILCALHKLKNFNKNLKLCGFSKEKKNEAKQLFSNICFSNNKQTVEKSFKSLFLFDDPVFVAYCRKLYSEKGSFSKAFIDKFTMGYNTSSIAESMNRMIKIDSKNRRISMAEFRKQFNAAHQRAEQNNIFSDSRKQFPVNFPFASIVPHVSKTCIIELYRNIQKSLKYSFEQIDVSHFKIQHYKNLEDNNIVIINQGNIECSCHQHILFGYPCVHMVTVLLNVKPNIPCLDLINKHWIINQGIEMNMEINETALLQLRNTVNISFNDELLDENAIDVNLNTQKRYSKILFMGKQLARIGSLATEEMYDQIINNLSELISVHSKPVNSKNDPIIAQPRKKGRKKASEQSKQVTEKCKICRGEHRSQDCTIFNYYVWRIKNPSGDKKLRKCGLCGSHGHNYATCDVKIGGILRVTDQMIFNFYGKTQPPDIRGLNDSLRITEMI